jgi:hypothetical protein
MAVERQRAEMQAALGHVPDRTQTRFEAEAFKKYYQTLQPPKQTAQKKKAAAKKAAPPKGKSAAKKTAPPKGRGAAKAAPRKSLISKYKRR